ncbi:MAG: type I-E CRISPR-associated protein Cse1/CasA [Winkia neuii]|uniref:type I-E CRISPR-associated protein Cse1/CasA n=1 Tax=Winkia neuii TaxID=33007 RepID=UPI0013045BCC|nr:type I-E CRISPR-associated protein Cse1/CasA [Winkia neuii]MDK8100423.1 type I-E CRISPR-associated protein Cse1/CasA [Winkia neuii]MDU3135625.1 type I-E CRISPR-associated protein Cse1/CasA [Winkia neuii]
MKYNALRGPKWIGLATGPATVEEALLAAHTTNLDPNVPGYEYGAQLRFLAYLLPLVLRNIDSSIVDTEEKYIDSDELLENGLPAAVVNKTLDKLLEVSYLDSPDKPFMQQPAAKHPDSTTKFRPKEDTVRKLLPTVPSEQGDSFWDLSLPEQESLHSASAARSLVVHSFYSMAGNGKYANRKMQMGAPGIRFLGKENSATEIFWRGRNLLETLLGLIPWKWVQGSGLPAWADREGRESKSADGHHPLWCASWSSNAPACRWENGRLLQVRIGGIPEQWYALEMGTHSGSSAERKAAAKAWWDTRNLTDPLYLYITGNDGKPHAARMDIGDDPTKLAVEWAARQNIPKFAGRDCLAPVPRAHRSLCFIRHQIGKTAQSPGILASVVYFPDPSKWVLDLNEELQAAVRDCALMIQGLLRAVSAPFRRARKEDTDPEGRSYALDPLATRKTDVVNVFWRNISDVYQDFIRSIQDTESSTLPRELYQRAVDASLSAFDEITEAYAQIYPDRIGFVRSRVSYNLRKTANLITPKKDVKK